MDEVIHYLQLKNQYYEKFHSITSRFWESVQSNDWSKTAEFTEQRDKILHLIRTYDFKISQALSEVDINDKRYDRFRPQISELLNKRKLWIERIVEIDLKVISIIDELKTERIKELENSLEDLQQAVPESMGTQRKTEEV